jgi:signal transduction histidine kinase
MDMIPAAAKGPAPRFGLSGKLLVLTTLFVMIAEILIYVPSIANFRVSWLSDRLSAAYTAALVLTASPEVPDTLARQLLDSIGAKAVAMKTGNQRRLLAVADIPPRVDQEVDVRSVPWYRAVIDAFDTLISTDNDVILAVGPAPRGGEFVEIIVDEVPLRKAMWAYSFNILLLSLLISGITAMLVYFTLHHMFVRPLHRLTANLIAFHNDPENPASVIAVSTRQDEVGAAERELAAMQRDLAGMLAQKSRLASLGMAVSKINHDLRNLLTTAQLFSDRLARLTDPTVQRFAPKLVRALERAISFCESTLSYGRVQEPQPDRRMVPLDPLVEEVRETLGLDADTPVRWISAIERGLMVDGDPDQLFRVLVNIARNAVQALESRAAADPDPGRDQVRIIGLREGAVVVIEVSDTGLGLSPQARAHLFEAFQSSNRSGGAGLGLAIAAELVRAHGGEIKLVDGTIGATFRVTIPDRAVELRARRDERASA